MVWSSPPLPLKEQPELVEPLGDPIARGVEHRGQGGRITAGNGEHATVEILTLYLQHVHEPSQRRTGGAVVLVETLEIHHDRRYMPGPGQPGIGGGVVSRQHLVNRN